MPEGLNQFTEIAGSDSYFSAEAFDNFATETTQLYELEGSFDDSDSKFYVSGEGVADETDQLVIIADDADYLAAAAKSSPADMDELMKLASNVAVVTINPAIFDAVQAMQADDLIQMQLFTDLVILTQKLWAG